MMHIQYKRPAPSVTMVLVCYNQEKYIKEARPKITEDTENALFVNSLGQRFTRQGLWKLIKKYASIANINKNINPSMLRHSFAIHLLNEGANIAVVSKILGNANLSSLQAYLNHINKKDEIFGRFRLFYSCCLLYYFFLILLKHI